MALKPFDLLRQVGDNFNLNVDPEKSEHENAADVTRSAALLCGAIAAEPIPWVDIAVILPLQVKLVVHIGKIYGFTLSRERARAVMLEIAGTVAYGWGARQLVRGVAKIALPVVGGLLTAPIAYAGTYALGNLAERYFRAQRGDLPPLTDEERREWTRDLLSRGREAGERVTASDLEQLREGLKERAAKRRNPEA